MTIALLRSDKAGIYNISDIYDPLNPNGTGRIVPQPPSLVVNNGQLFTVLSVDPNTYASTLVPAYTLNEDPNASVVSYGNDVFHLYYDNRTTPVTLVVEARCVILGGEPAYYNITRYPNTSQAVIISQHYGVSGNYIDQNTPMAPVTGVDNTWSFPSCVTAVTNLTDNEELLLQIFNAQGSLASTVLVHAKQASVIDEALDYRPRITAINLVGNQVTGPSQFFVYTQQSITSLFLSAQLTYDDGTQVTVPIDQQKCFLYGTEDFIASYPGLTQTLLVKYYLSPGELVAGTLNPLDGFISASVTVTVIPYPTVYSGKISVIPVWNTSLSAYTLRYFYYTLNRTATVDITAHVTLAAGTFSGTLYGVAQQLTLSVDLNLVNPLAYPTSTIYTQGIIVTLQPIAALVRYVLQDSTTALYVYGQDSTASRRPVLDYDSNLQQYYIPPSVFTSTALFLQSFYFEDSPPFDLSDGVNPPTPTHFLIRDAVTGLMVVSAMIPVSSYGTPFNIIGSPGSYVGKNVIVEFIQVVAGQNLILWGSPVDVYAKLVGS